MQSDRRNNARLSIIAGSRFFVIQNRPSRRAQLGPVGAHNKKKGVRNGSLNLQPIITNLLKAPSHFASTKRNSVSPAKHLADQINDHSAYWIALFIARS